MNPQQGEVPVPSQMQHMLDRRQEPPLQYQEPAEKPPHYYGDFVRKLFLAASIVMVLGLPFALDFLKLPMWQSLLSAVVLGLFAGLTTPTQSWAVFADLVISVVGLLYFEYFAILAYRASHWGIFLVDQLLAVIFVIALYYSTKSFRGRVLEKNN